MLKALIPPLIITLKTWTSSVCPVILMCCFPPFFLEENGYNLDLSSKHSTLVKVPTFHFFSGWSGIELPSG